MKISQRPYKFSFSKNPIQYTFSEISNYADAGCYLLIQIYKRDIGGANEVLLFTEQIKPLSATVIYDMASIAESSLEYAMPDFAGSVLQAGNNIKEFYVKFATITDAAPTPTYTSDTAGFIYGIKGGIPQPQWDWNNYFVNYVAANKPFLTWQPNNRFIGLNDSFFISFLNFLASVPLSLIVDVEYIDGTTDQVVTDFTDSTKVLYHIQAGPDQLGLNALHADKRLYKYSLSIVATSNHATIFVNPYTYYVDYRKFYNTKYLHYYNSLGGVEMVRINGMIETTADVTFTESEKFGGNVIIGSPNLEEYTQTAKSKVDSFKGDSGFIYTKAEQDVFQEILLTRFAWERIIGKNWRIYVTNKSTSLRKTSDKTWAIPLEWRYSFSNSVYAPVIDLGAGGDGTNYCIKPTISGSPSLPDGIAGVAYSYSFTLSGDTPITLAAITKPAWMTIAISGSTVSFTGTPAEGDVGSGIAVSVQFNNCAADSTTFADTLNVACVAFAGSTSFPIAHDGIPYTFSIYLSGIAPFTLSSFVGPSWMTATVVDDHIDFSGTPDTVDASIPISFTISSCTSLNYSGTMSVESSCDEYYNNTGGPLDITYTPCGTDTPVSITLTDGQSVCGTTFSGSGFAFLTHLGNCF